MINGIHVDVPSAEMKELFQGRLSYHQSKADALEKQLEQLKALDRDFAAQAEDIGKFSNAPAAQTIESQLKNHKDQTVYYAFMVAHVIPSEVYRLATEDLIRLGVSARGW